MDLKLKKIINQVPVDYYDKGNFLQKVWHSRKISSFEEIAKKRKYQKILDIGCAGGTLTQKMSQVLPNSQIIAIDIYQNAIKYAQQKYPNITFKIADAHKLPFRSKSFDLVVSYETIEHVVDPLKVFKEVFRVLKKDGHAIVAMDSGNWLFKIIWFFWENSKGKVWQGAHLHPFHHTQLEEIIKKSDFKILKKKFTHFGMEVTFILGKKANKGIQK